MQTATPFHLSLVTHDLERQREFYTELLGCRVARTAAQFEDYDFFGHQLTFHRRAASLGLPYETLHFGAIVSWEDFDRLCTRLKDASTHFIVEPMAQAEGTDDARRKLVVLDPSGYAVELKCYRDETRVLAHAPAYPR